MPTTPEMSMDMTTAGDTGLLETLQHEVALFARRAEQTRLGGVGQVRNSMDRAAYLLLNRLDKEGPMGVKALAASMGIDSSTVTRQVAPLVDTGLVKRTSLLPASAHGRADPRLGAAGARDVLCAPRALQRSPVRPYGPFRRVAHGRPLGLLNDPSRISGAFPGFSELSRAFPGFPWLSRAFRNGVRTEPLTGGPPLA